MAFGCLTKYVKVTFVQRDSLEPLPPINSKQEGVRYFHIFEKDDVDVAVLKSWIRQSAAIPGQKLF